MKQQSQIIFWLLLAATAAVDAVALTWLFQAGPTSRAAYWFDALVTGQLAVVCIWTVFTTQRKWLSLLAAALTVSLCSAVDVWATQLSAAESFGIYAGLASALIGTLWILKRTKFWQRLSGQQPIEWQFSIGQVLAAMTLVAVLITSLRGSQLLFGTVDIWRFLLLLTICDVMIVIATVVVWTATQHLLVRVATVYVIAGALGALLTAAGAAGLLGENVVDSFESEIIPNATYTIVISLVVFTWLELGSIIPLKRRAELPPPAATGDR